MPQGNGHVLYITLMYHWSIIEICLLNWSLYTFLNWIKCLSSKITKEWRLFIIPKNMLGEFLSCVFNVLVYFLRDSLRTPKCIVAHQNYFIIIAEVCLCTPNSYFAITKVLIFSVGILVIYYARIIKLVNKVYNPTYENCATISTQAVLIL